MTVVRKSTIQRDDGHPLEFVFSDSSVDAYDDSVDQNGWDLSDFVRNPIALLGHDPNFPIGTWTRVRVEAGKLRGHLQLAPEGTSQRIDEIRKLIYAGILKACSVGFAPIESIPRPGAKRGGRVYLQQRLVECSVVSTPANSNALMQSARGLGVSGAVIRACLRQTVDASLAERQAHARAALVRARAALERTKHLGGTKSSRSPAALIGMSPETRELYVRAKASRERAEALLRRARLIEGWKPPDERAEAVLRRARHEGWKPPAERLMDELAVPPQSAYRKIKGPHGW